MKSSEETTAIYKNCKIKVVTWSSEKEVIHGESGIQFRLNHPTPASFLGLMADEQEHAWQLKPKPAPQNRYIFLAFSQKCFTNKSTPRQDK